MRIVTPLIAHAQQQQQQQQQQHEQSSTNKRASGIPPEMRRAKSGDHLRRPRSNTSTQPIPEDEQSRPSRPPSQIIGEKAQAKHRGTVSVDAWRAAAEQKFTQEMFEREKSMDLIRREKSMDVRLESRLLMEREYRNSMGKPLPPTEHVQQPQRVRSEKSSPRTSPPQSLARTNSGPRVSNSKTNISGSRDSSFIADTSSPVTNMTPSHQSLRHAMTHSASTSSNISQQQQQFQQQQFQQQQQQQQRPPHEDLRRGGSVAAAREGMSYRQVFGLQSSNYLFNVTPPNYTRHRRFSDSDTESLHNFNFIHKVISTPTPNSQSSTPPTTHQSTQQLPKSSPSALYQTPGSTNAPSQNTSSNTSAGDDLKSTKILPKKWIKKVRRKSEDNPKRKVVAQLSNK